MPSWTMRLRRSWAHWRRTRRLTRQVRRLRRLVRRQEKALALQREFHRLLQELESPSLLRPSDSPTPTSEATPPPLVEPLPPPLTEAEMEALRALPMPDPLVEIEQALGLSTSPPSRPTSVG